MVKAVFIAAVLASGVAGGPWAAGQWENHLDASFIREIVYRDGALYMATNGGILIFNIAGGEFERLDNTAGLPSKDLNCLVFDDAGGLWIGSSDVGLARVELGPDELDVRTFSPLDLSGTNITSVAMWDGEIVYGTTTGAGKFEGGFPALTYNAGSSGLPSDEVKDVLVDGDYVWFATEAGAAVLDRLGFITPVPGGPASATALAASPGASDGAVWVGTRSGVWRMTKSDSSWAQLGPTGIRIDALHWDGQKMWAGGSYRVFEYDGTQWLERSLWEFYAKYGITSDWETRSIVGVPDGSIYVGAGSTPYRRGIHLSRFDGQWQNFVSNGPGENRIKRITRDVDGSIWVSAEGYGVGKLTPSGAWVNYNPSIPASDSLSNLFNNLACLADADGVKWFSTLTTPGGMPLRPLDELDDQLDSDYTNDVWTHHALGSGGGDRYGTLRPQRAALDPAGNRWFLADESVDEAPIEWHGIHIFNREKTAWLQVKPETEPRMGTKGNITHVAFGDGVAYIAILDYGVKSWNIGGGYDWPSLSNLTDDVWSAELDARIGRELSNSAQVTSLALRSDGVLWIGTTVGVYKYTPGTGFRQIQAKVGQEVGLLSPKVTFLLLDHHDNLWVATELGLNRISRQDDNEIAAYTTAAAFQLLSEVPVPYPSSVISPLADAACNDLVLHPERDLLYVATQGGLSIVDITPPEAERTDLARVYVYPNPIDGSRGHVELMIDNVTSPVTIEIYNLEGDLVHSATATESEQPIWDLTTSRGYIVASGVYLVRINNGADSVVKPIAVIR